jgi:hypothetical protein
MLPPGVNFTKIFHTKVFCAPFMCLQFGFVIFWRKDFGAKAVNKMLVKLTPWWQKLAADFPSFDLCLNKSVLNSTQVHQLYPNPIIQNLAYMG